jgi:hypothetical protein
VWGNPNITRSLGGAHYFVSFTDDWSLETQIYTMENKSNAFEKYQIYEKWVNVHRNA